MKLESLKKRYFSLDSKVEVYLPSMTVEHMDIDPVRLAEIRVKVGRKMSSMFGGATITRAMGFYENQALSSTQLEEVEIVYSYCAKLEPNQIRDLVAIAESLKIELQQESVMLVINGTALFV